MQGLVPMHQELLALQLLCVLFGGSWNKTKKVLSIQKWWFRIQRQYFVFIIRGGDGQFRLGGLKLKRAHQIRAKKGTFPFFNASEASDTSVVRVAHGASSYSWGSGGRYKPPSGAPEPRSPEKIWFLVHLVPLQCQFRGPILDVSQMKQMFKTNYLDDSFDYREWFRRTTWLTEGKGQKDIYMNIYIAYFSL